MNELNETKNETVSEVKNTNSLRGLVKTVVDNFHRYGLWIILSVAVGVYGGITASKRFYNDKLNDCILVQGMVINGKPYSITPK